MSKEVLHVCLEVFDSSGSCQFESDNNRRMQLAPTFFSFYKQGSICGRTKKPKAADACKSLPLKRQLAQSISRF